MVRKRGFEPLFKKPHIKQTLSIFPNIFSCISGTWFSGVLGTIRFTVGLNAV